MKNFGLIQAQETKQKLFSKKRKYFCEKAEELPIPLFLLWIPYSKDELCKFPQWILKRIDRKARSALKKHGVKTVFLSRELESVFPWDGEAYWEEPMSIPDEIMPEALQYLFSLKQVQQDTLHIFDRDGVCRLHILKEFCKMVRYLCIYTDAENLVSGYARDLCDEYGVLPEVRPYSELFDGRRLYVKFSAKRNVVGIDNFVIDGMNPNIEFKGYPLKRKEVYASITNDTILPIGWFSGKKRLTS